jgi:cell division septation protein DedD
MRDAYRLKEKIELQLDNRQVVSMAVGALALLGVAFVLGVMVGKQLQREAAAVDAGAQDPLAALDARTDAQGTLFAEARAAETATVAVAVPAAVPEKTGDTDSQAAGASGSPVAERSVSPVFATATDTATVSDSDAAPPAETQPMKPPPGALDADAPRPAPGEFTVQVGAYQDREEAEGLARKLRAAGFRPFLVEVDIPAKGIWFRVRVGRFTDREAADRYRKDLERELQTAAVIMKE